MCDVTKFSGLRDICDGRNSSVQTDPIFGVCTEGFLYFYINLKIKMEKCKISLSGSEV